jgi:NO-binding membrane sensor protein with MHYT domain/ActR/RegA family two-component response regulator/two-component sensor histidine kinase
MEQHYHHGLIFISIAVAILASYTALTLALRIRSASGWPAHAWLLGGGLAMGIGIWAMHFVGMLALSLPIAISYDVWITAISMAIAIVVSTFALRIASRAEVSRPRLIAAGIAMGIGICSMHYVGMAAIIIQPAIRYDPYWVTASLAIAIAASFAALWVAFSQRDDGWWHYRLLLGGIVMGFAIAGMHYAGMSAAEFPAGAASSPAAFVDTGWLAGSVTTISVFILMATLLITVVDAQAAARRRRMQVSLAEARESSRAKDEFLAMLGHELRNPLGAISNAIFLLKRAEPKSGEWSFAQDVIDRQSSHLKRLVDDLLDVGRAISGKMSLELRPLDLRRSVESALEVLATAGRTRERRIDWQGSSVWVRGDQARLQQVVTNLVTNAAENTPPGGAIEVRLERQGDDACLSVRDHGVGLDPDTAAHVFDLFFQANQGIQRPKGGLGVGLTLVRRIIELHNGEVSVASSGPGKGATFTVRLPAAEAPALTASAQRRVGQRRRRNVLVIEDADDARNSLRLALEVAGHEVHTASDGASGLRALLELRPEVALIDIGLPELDGYEVARRARLAGVNARLIALTGYGLPDDKAQAAAAGFDVHLTKPAAVERILGLVSNAKLGEA